MNYAFILPVILFSTSMIAEAQTPKAQVVKGVAELQSQVHWQNNDSFMVDQMISVNMRENHQKKKPASCQFKVGTRVDGRYTQAQTRNEVENNLLAAGIKYIGFESVLETPFLPAPKIAISPNKKAAWALFRSVYLPQIEQRATTELNAKPYLRWFESINLPENEVGVVCNEIKQYMSVVYRMKLENITCDGNTFSTNLSKQDWIKQSQYYYFPVAIEKCEYPEEEIEWEN